MCIRDRWGSAQIEIAQALGAIVETKNAGKSQIGRRAQLAIIGFGRLFISIIERP